MEVLKIGVLLDDKAFAKAFIRSLSRCCSLIIYIVLYDESSINSEYLDLVITDKNLNQINIVHLTDKSDTKQLNKIPYSIYKYESNIKNVSDLLLIFFHLTGKVIELSSDTRSKSVAVAALGGGYGNTSITISLCKSLNVLYGYRCIYINFAALNDSCRYFENNEINSSLKLSYYLKYKDDFPLESFISNNMELDSINTGVINEFKPEDCFRLINKIESLSKYDYIFIDIGNNINKLNHDILKNCNLVVIVDCDKRPCTDKYRKIILEELKESSEDMLYIMNFCDENSIFDGFKISEDKEAFRVEGDKALIDLRRNYGVEIECIAREIEDRVNG